MRLILLILILQLPNFANAQAYDWHLAESPTNNAPQVYGSYAGGCMDGGIRLQDAGAGFIMGDMQDNRAYGQPALIEYINKLGQEAAAIDRTLIIGDLASPRGGPAPITSSLHRSHQTGLDVDIWFRTATRDENPHVIEQVSMLDKSWKNINNKYWGNTEIEILARAASFPEVDRIFVNPVIKRELCKKHFEESWISKIRAWKGHAAHFHVRLKCPENNPFCKPQDPFPAGNGCGQELDWWFSDDAKQDSAKPVPKLAPSLPAQCSIVSSWKNN